MSYFINKFTCTAGKTLFKIDAFKFMCFLNYIQCRIKIERVPKFENIILNQNVINKEKNRMCS